MCHVNASWDIVEKLSVYAKEYKLSLSFWLYCCIKYLFQIAYYYLFTHLKLFWFIFIFNFVFNVYISGSIIIIVNLTFTSLFSLYFFFVFFFLLFTSYPTYQQHFTHRLIHSFLILNSFLPIRSLDLFSQSLNRLRLLL